MKQIAIFASGTGTNTARIIDHFRLHARVKVGLIVCNNALAGVLTIAAKEGIPFIVIEKEKFFRGDGYLGELREKKIDYLVLAGFLWKIPSILVQAYRGRIINIHPALLPKYGGKGMYGMYVHEAVIAAKEKQSGITIHFVDEWYDHGQIIFSATCEVQKIHLLEYAHFANIVEEVVNVQNQS
jgi:phosphoribosylglycinamide formyltransferase-1